MDCFNHNCPFRTNETSNVNRCDCYACQTRYTGVVYIASNHTLTNEQHKEQINKIMELEIVRNGGTNDKS